MPFWGIVIVGALGMLAQDFLASVVTVAQARGRSKMVAGLKILQDGAQLLTLGIGVGYAKDHGLTWHSVIVVAALMFASAVGGYLGTREGSENISAAESAKEAFEGNA